MRTLGIVGRWIAVLPAALGAMFLLSIVLSLLRPILIVIFGIDFPETKSSTLFDARLNQDAGSDVFNLVRFGGQAAVFVLSGALVAPSHRFGAGVALSSIYAFIVIGFMALMLVFAWPELGIRPVWGVLRYAGAVVIGLFVALSVLRESHGDGSKKSKEGDRN